MSRPLPNGPQEERDTVRSAVHSGGRDGRLDEMGSILSIWAHPDDETFLSGGIMAAAADAGQPVTCVSATCGEHGTDQPRVWPPERLGRLRQWECRAAMAVLGVDDHRFLGFEDGTLSAIDPARGTASVAELIDELRPDTILTFGPDGMTFHPDHIAVHRWVRAAWEALGRPARLLEAAVTVDRVRQYAELYERWGVFMTDERPEGVPVERLGLHFELAGASGDRKIAALRAMHSQVSAAADHLGEEAFRAMNTTESFVAVG